MKSALEKTHGLLYCVCSMASLIECERCPKGRALNPDHTLRSDKWRRVVKEFVK